IRCLRGSPCKIISLGGCKALLCGSCLFFFEAKFHFSGPKRRQSRDGKTFGGVFRPLPAWLVPPQGLCYRGETTGMGGCAVWRPVTHSGTFTFRRAFRFGLVLRRAACVTQAGAERSACRQQN